ncbi:hypothetical protein [Halovenus salina]|uniref:Uncharacterized protein n=1 Tax=Halovenus salina TaxID=1510225 RepID=A0ABD5W384_9EURY|nr:hypothetical protein [Halovenus salina]
MSDYTGRWSLLGLAGVTSLCCLGLSSAAVTGGAAAVTGGAAASGAGAGLAQVAATAVTLAVVALVVRWRRCSDCPA